MTTTTTAKVTRIDRNGRPPSHVREAIAYLLCDGTDRAACRACGREAIRFLSATADNAFNIGHVVSDAFGGRMEIGNVIPLCRACNLAIGDTDLSENDYYNGMFAPVEGTLDLKGAKKRIAMRKGAADVAASLRKARGLPF